MLQGAWQGVWDYVILSVSLLMHPYLGREISRKNGHYYLPALPTSHPGCCKEHGSVYGIMLLPVLVYLHILT